MAASQSETNKLAFVLLSQFQIENLLANILRELHLKEASGFYSLSKTIIDHFALGKDAHDILYLPAAIRNSPRTAPAANTYEPKRKTAAGTRVGQWVTSPGYITGINRTKHGKADYSNEAAPQGLVQWLDNCCKQNPLSSFSLAVDAMLEELGKKK